MTTYRYTTAITAAQIDVLGHLNNAAYLAIFEVARWDVLAQTGVIWADLVSLGVSPVILEVNLKFRREVRQDEVVIVETTHSRTGPRRFLTRQRMVDGAGKVRATADLTGSFLDVRTRRIVDPPEPVLRAIGLVDAEVPPPVVQGLGGAFLYATDVNALAAWYTTHFGLTLQTWGEARGIEFPSVDMQDAGRTTTTTFALFQAASPLAAARTGRVNLRVSDLDTLLARLRAAEVPIEAGTDASYGRFAWVIDPEGNRLELWEPPRLDRG